MSFEDFGADLLDGLAAPDGEPANDPAGRLLLDEVRLGCTLAMLQCLDRDHRIAYILGELFDLSSEDAAWICGTTPPAHRKRLSRARTRVRDFMSTHCGLVEATAACTCAGRTPRALALGRVDPAAPALTGHPVSTTGDLLRTAHDLRNEADRLRDAAAVMRAHLDYAAPDTLNRALQTLLSQSALADHT